MDFIVFEMLIIAFHGGGSLAIIYSMNKIKLLKIYRFTLVNKNEMTFQKSQNK